MTKIGITGGIGSGKSTISKIIEALGYPVYYADIRGKWLTQFDPNIISAIKSLFGNAIYRSNGTLDSAKVASIVFNDAKELAKLNAIIHPAVGKDFELWCSKTNSTIIFKEAAIMFESGANKGLDKTICISAPQNIRIERVKKRDKVKAHQITERIKNQMTDEERIKLSDFVIINDGRQFVLPQIKHIINQIKQP